MGAAVEYASDLAGIAREYDAIRERTSENGRRKTDHGPASDPGLSGRRPGHGRQNANRGRSVKA
jgi:hypothetical protein